MYVSMYLCMYVCNCVCMNIYMFELWMVRSQTACLLMTHQFYFLHKVKRNNLTLMHTSS